ncbi:hypothetical protein Q5752_006434 [Cryptotrichosporon argae]
MGRGGATSSRGRGKFKVARGGGRHFSRDVDPRFRNAAGSGSEEESSEDESQEEEEDGPAAEAKLAPEMAALNLKLGNTVEIVDDEPEISRAERKALKKAQAGKKAVAKDDSDEGSDDDDEGANPANKGKKAAPPPPQLSRREKEAADKKAAQERYQKLHAQGKTAEAKSDMARLQEIRKRREAAAAQREAEAAEAAKEAAAKKEKLQR